MNVYREKGIFSASIILKKKEIRNKPKHSNLPGITVKFIEPILNEGFDLTKYCRTFLQPGKPDRMSPELSRIVMTAPHGNDSNFLDVTQFSGLTPRDAFRSFNIISLIQGVMALLTAIILYLVL